MDVSTNETFTLNHMKQYNTLVFAIYTLLVATGFVGNTLLFLVTAKTSLKKLSTSVYLSVLAVSDNAVLLFSNTMHF